MPDLIGNDNDATIPVDPEGVSDPHGRAALLLVESLLHGLIDRSLLSVAEATEIIATASDVKAERILETGPSVAAPPSPLSLLGAIHASLSIDLPRTDD